MTEKERKEILKDQAIAVLKECAIYAKDNTEESAKKFKLITKVVCDCFNIAINIFFDISPIEAALRKIPCTPVQLVAEWYHPFPDRNGEQTYNKYVYDLKTDEIKKIF